jgi:hypothetical protein
MKKKFPCRETPAFGNNVYTGIFAGRESILYPACRVQKAGTGFQNAKLRIKNAE